MDRMTGTVLKELRNQKNDTSKEQFSFFKMWLWRRLSWFEKAFGWLSILYSPMNLK